MGDEYRELMEDIGAEIVTLWGYWIIKVMTIIELCALFVEIFCGLDGNNFGWAFAALLGAMVIGFVNIVYRMNILIEVLEEKRSGIELEKKKSPISVLLPIGLLISCCMILIDDLVASFISYPIRIFAIVLIIAGFVQTLMRS